MLVQELLDCLKTNSLSSAQKDEVKSSASKFPYSAILQQLAYNVAEDEQDVQVASLYKTHPFLFCYNKAKFKIQSKRETKTESKIESTKESSIESKIESKIDSSTTKSNKQTAEEPAQNNVEAPIKVNTEVNADINTAITPNLKNDLNHNPSSEDELLIMPLHTEDFFTAQGIKAEEADVKAYVSDEKAKAEKMRESEPVDEKAQLLITRSFQDWLDYFKEKREKEQKENEDKQALRVMWQKEKLSKASEEENDLVPENVFKMAIDSLQPSDSTISEALANIMVNQGKFSRAIEMYRKLSLQNPEKSAYFAAKIKEVEKLN